MTALEHPRGEQDRTRVILETNPLDGRHRWRCDRCLRVGVWLDRENEADRNGVIHDTHCSRGL